MVYYKREADGLLHLYDDVANVRVHASAQVAVAYSLLREDGGGGWKHAPTGATRVHVFTHGTPEAMTAWVAMHNSASPHKAEVWVSDDPVVLNEIISGTDARGHTARLASLL